jgi:hypothetical protein
VTVSGTGFKPGEKVDIQIANAGPQAGSLHLAFAHADSQGAFHAAQLRIPADLQAGSYVILALGVTSSIRGQTPLTVTTTIAHLSIDRKAFVPGALVHIAGTHFAPGEQVVLVLSTANGTTNVHLRSVNARPSGAFGPVAVRIPFGVPAGRLDLVAIGRSSGRQAGIPVTVRATQPGLSLSSGAVTPGEAVTISGTHFQPGETVWRWPTRRRSVRYRPMQGGVSRSPCRYLRARPKA